MNILSSTTYIPTSEPQFISQINALYIYIYICNLHILNSKPSKFLQHKSLACCSHPLFHSLMHTHLKWSPCWRTPAQSLGTSPYPSSSCSTPFSGCCPPFSRPNGEAPWLVLRCECGRTLSWTSGSFCSPPFGWRWCGSFLLAIFFVLSKKWIIYLYVATVSYKVPGVFFYDMSDSDWATWQWRWHLACMLKLNNCGKHTRDRTKSWVYLWQRDELRSRYENFLYSSLMSGFILKKTYPHASSGHSPNLEIKAHCVNMRGCKKRALHWWIHLKIWSS